MLQGPLVRRRLVLAMVLFFLLLCVVFVRLIILQLVRGEELTSRAVGQWTRESVISARRGTIFDRNGKILAVSASASTVSVSPRQVDDPETFARLLAPILDLDFETIRRKASDRSKGGVTLKRQLTREVALELKSLLADHAESGSDALNGLYLEEDTRRSYPMGAFASQLLGLTTIDGVGQSGLEKSLDNYLTGRDGSIHAEIDGRGRSLGGGDAAYVPAVDGCDVILTIDAPIQAFAEQAAREAITINGAVSVRVLVMDPQTGAILAMVSKPDYDPNVPPRNDVATLTALMRNTVIADAYEPGSTFKIITTAAALDSGVTRTTEGFYCSGSVLVEGGRVRCWGNPHGAESMAESLENSCNPVFVELGLRLGIPRFYDYLDAFGFGSVTGVDIAGEAAGIRIAESVCKRVDLARIGFGQSIAVTPLQLLTAACAAVNGGVLYRPYVVERIVDGDGNVVEQSQPHEVSRPISAETSAVMRSLLEGVVENGGGRNAYLEGYRVGGKTGTAQVYVNGAVSSDTHIGSFLGFAPIDDPKIAVLFIVDEAEKRPDFGSVTSAPFAGDILLKSLNYLGYWSSEAEGASEAETTVPDLCGMPVSAAFKALSDAGLRGVVDGDGDTVLDQLPAAGRAMPEGSIVMLYVEEAEVADERVSVPDVTGCNVSDAEATLSMYLLEMSADGAGLAVSQTPAAGTAVAPTTVVSVRFEAPGPAQSATEGRS